MKEALVIETSREGYSIAQCDKGITVGQLISVLEGYDEDLHIYFKNDNGYTYGTLWECDIEKTSYDEEDC